MGRKGMFFSNARILLFILILFSLSIGQIASAEGGTGGGKNEPLTLSSSSISDGATGVSLKPEIVLTFSKNIVNMKVVENNKKCFSLQTEDGVKVPINLFLADDQIEFEKRNDAIITPVDNLTQGTTYFIVVSGSLTSKSGISTGKETRISFTTKGEKPEPNNDGLQEATPQSEPSTPVNKDTPKSEPVVSKDSQTTKRESKNKTENKNTASTTSKVDEKPAAEQAPSEEAEENVSDDDKLDANQQLDEDSAESEPTIASEIEAAKSVPYEKASAPIVEAAETPSSNKNTYIYLLVIIGVAMIASVMIYFYKRKKHVKQ
ncbi:Ig-like domain-containing protein [Bacillus sp. Bva_UNVM-123]|uniref:Ig-like domain-containing protein n=1 Tax=Bacillus sp. Bva_UNVM-123 TaxID=2829798 RepID=UPI00391F2F37